MRGSSQNAVPVYKQREWYFEEEIAQGGLRRLFALASRGVGEKGETGEETFNPQQYREKSQGGGERRAKRGDQAYAPFGAGRETGHQVPVVAAKIESDR